MEREQVLVSDNRGIFLKMFKRKFKDQFNFLEHSLSSKIKVETDDFDRYIYVIHDKSEFLEFLKIEQKEKNTLICLFDKQLYNSLFFIEEIKNFVFIDASKTRTELIKDLKSYFKKKTVDSSETIKTTISNSQISKMKFYDYYKAVFFLI